MTVIPAINAKNKEEAENQLGIISEFSKLVHLDIADGKFTKNKTWGSPQEARELLGRSPFKQLGIKLEIHLMVENPDEVVEEWLTTGLVQRVIVHVETAKNPEVIADIAQKYAGEAMLAATPQTALEKLTAHKDHIKMFQVLGVNPGVAGQTMQKETVIKRIKELRKLPGVIIEVDGGINLKTAKLVQKAGADIIVSASYILNSKDPQKAYRELIGL